MDRWAGYDPPIAPDRHPSFFCAYWPPSSHVAALVQKPAHNINADALSVAYMRDWRLSRRQSSEGGR